jgi:ABC-type branched-subunit amino acid transport system substrate-binding protein
LELETLTVGLSANLENSASVHREAFINAINLALENLKLNSCSQIRFIMVSDQASANGGKTAAKTLIKAGVQCVIGHFASVAAEAACNFYDKVGIPVLLPAATANSLTTKYNVAFRLCGNDKQLAQTLLEYISTQTQAKRLLVHSDKVLGNAVFSSIMQGISSFNTLTRVTVEHLCDAVIFAGTFEESTRFITQQRELGFQKPIFLTDDTIHPALVTAIHPAHQNQIFACGPCPADQIDSAAYMVESYKRKFDSNPKSYCLETYTAMEIIQQISTRTNHKNIIEILNDWTWETILGNVKFNRGESNCTHYSMWKIEKNRLVTVA